MPLDVREIAHLRAHAAPIVILTGAGISRESGLDTFRDSGGIWDGVRVEELATPEAFAHDPERVHAFYNLRRRGLLDPAVAPNAAHRALVRLEQAWPGPVLIATQNVDDLHERAGTSPDVLIHLHGELLKARCAHCGHVGPVREDLSVVQACTACGEAGGLRPHVVWFGEMPLGMDRVRAALAEAEIFIAIGTSGNVWPAAGFVGDVSPHCHTVKLNLEPTAGAGLFQRCIHGPASEIVPAFVRRLCPDTGAPPGADETVSAARP